MTRTILLLLFISFATNSARAQDFDYQAQPEFDYSFEDAQINLRVNPQKVALEGFVNYSMKANISGADTLLLNAVGITIDSVMSQGRRLSFEQNNRMLRIALTDSSHRGRIYPVKIYYEAAPHFGLLKSSEGTVWTSMLPRSTRHWLPARDNPRTRMNITFSLRIPDDYKVFASGIIRGKHRFRDSTKQVTFRTGSAIPITSLTFGVGHFHGINSFAEANSIAPEEQRKLVRKTKQIIQQISKATGVEYPFHRVTLAILNDDHWETKSYGASTVFLYKNRGDWMTQLRSGLIAQWVGVYLNEGQWADSWPIRFMQTALLNQITNSGSYMIPYSYAPQTPFTTVYNHFGLKNWNFWQEYNTWNLPNVKNIVLNVMHKLLKAGPATITPQKFKMAWYKASGQRNIKLPAHHPKTALTNKTANADSAHYRVDFTLNRQTSTLKISLKADSIAIRHPVALQAVIISDSSNQNQTIYLSGAADSTTITLPFGTKNVRLKAPDRQKLVLKVYKPVPYSLYQLRNAKNVDVKTRAARQLGYHTNEPDLQLALVNAMKKDNAPAVQAALLWSYANITQGATGTQKYFLNALSSDNRKVQLAALEGLKNYKGSSITQKLKSFTQNAANARLANRAFNIYMQRIDSTKALNYVNTLVRQDTSGTRAIVGVEALVKSGYTQRARKYASFYVKPFYSYPVRKKALKILVQGSDSTMNWNKHLNALLNDYDPRIRYLTVKYLDKIPLNADSVLADHKEYDARVYKKMLKIEHSGGFGIKQ